MDPLSITASVAGLLQAISATCATIKTIANLPKAFVHVETHLPLAQRTLSDIRSQLEQQQITEADRRAVLHIIQECETKARQLQRIFDALGKKFAQDQNTKSWDKLRGWYRELLQSIKSHPVESLMNDILEDMRSLGLRQTFKLATQEDVADIKKALEEIARAEPSLDDTTMASMRSVYASQTVHTGAIAQQNIVEGGINNFHSGHKFEYSTVTIVESGPPLIGGSSKPNMSNEEIKEAIVKSRKKLGPQRHETSPLLGTCEWLSKIREINCWIRDGPQSHSLLWIYGGPGRGKSHLASRLISDLKAGQIEIEAENGPSTTPLRNNSTVLRHFCNSSVVLPSTELAVVLDLLDQLLERPKPEKLYRIISTKLPGRDLDLFSSSCIKDLWECLYSMIKEVSQDCQVYIVLDGLDECDISSRDELASHLRQLCKSGQQNGRNAVQVGILSRPVLLHQPADLVIDLHAEEHARCTSDDIRKFVEYECTLIENREQYCRILTERANGTFLWVALAISLQKKGGIDAQKVVEEDFAYLNKLLPVGLGEMYNRILSEIAESVQKEPLRQDMMRMFRCLIVSGRPLTTEEIAFLADCSDDTVHIALSRFAHILTKICERDGGESIELIHLSFKEFMLQKSSRLVRQEIFWSTWSILRCLSNILHAYSFHFWTLDYVALIFGSLHHRGLLIRHCELGFLMILLVSFLHASQQRRCSFLMRLCGQTLGKLAEKLLMVIFGVHEEDAHRFLFERCLKIMSDEQWGLKRDIRDDELSPNYRDERTVEKRWRRVVYPTRHWVAHLERSGPKPYAKDKVERFLLKYFLHWVEAMAHLGVTSRITRDLEILEERALVTNEAKLSDLLNHARQFMLRDRHMINAAPSSKFAYDDGRRLIGYFRKGLEADPLQTYKSMSLFAPTGSFIHQYFGKDKPINITMISALRDKWHTCLQTLEDHSRKVTSVTFSHDSKLLASASEDHTVKIWDTSSGTCLHSLSDHRDKVYSVVFSHDSKKLASASNDCTIKIWDTSNGYCLHSLENHTNKVVSVVFSHHSKMLASAALDHTVRIWDTTSGNCLRTFKNQSNMIPLVVFSHKSTKLASASRENRVEVWDSLSGVRLHNLGGHRKFLKSMVFSHDSTKIATASADCTVKIWDVERGICLHTFERHRGFTTSVVFSHDSKKLASASLDHTVKIWDTDSGDYLKNLKGHMDAVVSVAFSHNSKQLASASYDCTVKIWDTSRGTCLQNLRGHNSWLKSAIFSYDSTKLASISDDCTIKIWDTCIATESQPLIDHNGRVNSIAFSDDSRKLASASEDCTVKIWDTSDGTCLYTLDCHRRGVNSVIFSHDSKKLASASEDRTVRIWDSSSGACLHVLGGHKDHVQLLAFSSDSAKIAATSCDEITIWDTRSGRRLRTLRHYPYWAKSVIFSKDAAKLASVFEGRIIGVWDVESGDCLHSPQSPMNETLLEILRQNISSVVSEDIQQPQGLRSAIVHLSPDGKWMMQHSKRLFWVPQEYRPSCWNVSGAIAGVGTGMGKVWICMLNDEHAEHEFDQSGT